jgi:hypothetical protein
MNQVISGVLIAGYATAGLFFLRFWKSTHDRLFMLFAVAFWILSLQRVLFAVTNPTTEDAIYLYILRLVAFIVILIAIIDKNRS